MFKKKENIFIDSNSFYYFCDFIGSPSNVDNVKGNQSIDYDLLYKEFSKIIKSRHKVLCLSPTVVLEAIVHFRNTGLKVDEMFNSFRIFWQKNKFELGYHNYSPFLQAVDKNGISILHNILILEKDPSDYIDDALSEKIKSEAELTTLFVYMIFITYIFMFYKLNETTLNSVMAVFGKVLVSQYESILKPSLSNLISQYIFNAYTIGTEDKVIQNRFDGLLEICAKYCVSIIENNFPEDEIKDYLKSMLSPNNKPYSKKIRRWYLDNAKEEYFVDIDGIKKKTIDFVIDTIRPAIICKVHNEGQFQYLKFKILDFYNSGKIIEKNDAEDYWLMYLTEKGDLLTFDKYMRKIIRQTNPKNADYINGLAKDKI